MGWIFSAAMLAAAALSFGLTSITPGRYSAIHLLSVLTLATIPLGIWRRRHGDIRGHAIAMASNYIGLVIAGAFALTAPRLLHTAFFAL